MHRHRFEAKHHKRLDSTYRRRILPPSTTLKRFGLKRGMDVADIGSGSGYFLISAARIVGKDSTAYAVDASEEMLAVLKSKKPPSNVVAVHTRDGYSFKVDSDSVDFVIASAILHENEPVRFLREIRRIMRPKATLLIIDWRKESLRAGPPMEERLTPAEVKAFLAKSKLKTGKVVVLNSRYFAVTAKKV